MVSEYKPISFLELQLMIIDAEREAEKWKKQRDELAWAIAWFLKGGSREKLKARFKAYEDTL